jgi:hypothetical protein
MKTITISVSEPVYEEFQRAARSRGKPISELIREALEIYRLEHLRPRHESKGFRPPEPLSRDDDLLAEMLGSEP